MGTLRWQKEDEGRRARDLGTRDAELREREAELALAETDARARVVAVERGVREAALDRLKVVRAAEVSRATARTLELKQRRGSDELEGTHAKKARRART